MPKIETTGVALNAHNLLTRIILGLTLLLSMVVHVWAVENVIYYHNDALGSPVLITDNTGQVLWREAYEPYGKRVTNAGGHNTLWYTGKPEDKELGLSYFGARWYDPTVGRFTGIDPVDVQADNIHSFNRYAYANNNPYRYVDPDGRLGTSIHALQRGMTLDNALWVGAAGDSALYTAGGGAAAVASVAMPDPTDVGIAGALITKGLSKVKERAGIVAKDGTRISGLTKHGVDRVIGDGEKRAGTKPDALLDSLKNPAKIKAGIDNKGRPFKIYTGANARTVINPETGKIVSTNPLARDGAHLP